jgi:hypothetical protein
MTIHDELLPFLAARDDPLSWLAAADLCEERGDLPRAKYLRACRTPAAAELGLRHWGGMSGINIDDLEGIRPLLPAGWTVTYRGPGEGHPAGAIHVGRLRSWLKHSVYLLRHARG